jgi:uncharacterized protein DUF1524
VDRWVKFRELRWWWQALAWIVAWPVPLGLWAWSLPRSRRVGPALLAAASLAVWVAVLVASGGQPGATRQDGTTATTVAPSTTTTTGLPTSTTAADQPTTTTGAPATSSTSSPSTTSTTATTRPTTTSTSGPVATTTTSTAPAGGGGDDATAILAGLRVAPEGARTGYSRDLFPHWIDADHDSCDTREEVLIAESSSPAQVEPSGCKVLAGDWVSLYDGVTTEDPSTFDIDHVVALAEAWDSGASGWTTDRRRAFANDLDHPQSLRAVTASSNRSKSDLDPAQWKPTRDGAWCEYARDWVTTKKTWDLSADHDEVDDLRVMLRTCR